jgi:CrcB protein
MYTLLAVAIGGAFGSVLRFAAAQKITQATGNSFPYGILFVNVVGCFAIGILSILLLDRFSLSPAWRAGILIGFLGGFTTFSSFSLDTFNLFEQGAYLAATLNILLNTGLCVIATFLGVFVGRLVTSYPAIF